MQTMKSLTIVLSLSTAMASSHVGAAGPAPAPAPGPAGPTLNTLAVQWEIKNLNYYDLTKPWTDPAGKLEADSTQVKKFVESYKKDPRSKKAPTGPEGLGDIADTLDKGLENVAKSNGTVAGPEQVAKDFDKAGADAAAGVENAAKDIDDAGADGAAAGDDVAGALGNVAQLLAAQKRKRGFALLNHKKVLKRQAPHAAQSGKITVQKALRRSIEDSIKKTLCEVKNLVAVPGPAPAPQPAPAVPLGLANAAIPPPINAGAPAPAAAFLSTGTSLRGQSPAPIPAFAPAPFPAPSGPPCAQPKVHVVFAPGKLIKRAALLAVRRQPSSPSLGPPPRTTIVKVSIFDTPNNQQNDIAMAMPALNNAVANGDLMRDIQIAVKKVVGFTPKLGGIKIKHVAVKGWDIVGCENHMSKLVKVFTVHYTKRQVPMALYNACTDFTTKMSFTHDYVLDPRDAARCRHATVSFARRWKLGKKDNPKDFEDMCVRFCEAKYGNDAPTCHVTHGEKLVGQPM